MDAEGSSGYNDFKRKDIRMEVAPFKNPYLSPEKFPNRTPALLVLSDGTVFEGNSFGADGETIGEVVFNTSMTGYQEILTDPSYRGQIVTMTYTQIGNYGVNSEDIESRGGPDVEGFIVKEYLPFPSNWRAEKFKIGNSLGDYLKEYKIVCIEGIDTRGITRHLRDHGSQMGIISTKDLNHESLLKKVKRHPGIVGIDLVKEVTSRRAYSWKEVVWKWRANVKDSKYQSIKVSDNRS